MARRSVIIWIAALAFSLTAAWAQDKPLYLNEEASTDVRINDLLRRLTTEEKMSLMLETSPGIPRLGIPKYFMGNEALHGIIRPGRFTVFPQAIALAAMWNPQLHYKIASAISDEARARWNELGQGEKQKAHYSDLLVFWSPTVNMARDPRWGRTPETYGEDPFLSGTLGAQFVRGLQGNNPKYLKVVSTPKHFTANNEEHNRFSCKVAVSERDLREYYLPAFELCVRNGHAQSIMTAYDALNGVPCTVNDWLLRKVLRGDWGFDGYIVSDCGAPANVVREHHFVEMPETAAKLCVEAGLDLECGGDIYTQPLKDAFHQNMISEAQIDSAAYHLLRARMRLGLFDDAAKNPYNEIPPSNVGCPEHQQLALEAARQSVVLLKNDAHRLLPVNLKKLKSVAVVGVNAAQCVFGDYSGRPLNHPLSILEGIRSKVGGKAAVNYVPWVSSRDGLEIIEGASFLGGLKAEYYSGREFKGTPVVRSDQWINFEPSNQAPDPQLPESPLSIRWTGVLNPAVSGSYVLSFQYDDGGRLILDGDTLVDHLKGSGMHTHLDTLKLVSGHEYKLCVEYNDDKDYALARLSWRVPQTDKSSYFASAVEAAKKSDLVVAVMGINNTIEREGKDRESIELPSDQQEFLRAVYAANKNMILVLVAGSSLALNWEDANIPAIVDAWYPGEQGGNAVADVLFGDYNPAGRLPLTFYKSMSDLPPFNDYSLQKGRTYRYFQGKPLYPFGHGLSYTAFAYSNLKVTEENDSVSVSFRIRNKGARDGEEVSQLYVRLPVEGAPQKELKGFCRTFIGKGKTGNVSIKVAKEQLRYWDEKSSQFMTVQPKDVQFMVGASSSDIRLTKE